MDKRLYVLVLFGILMMTVFGVTGCKKIYQTTEIVKELKEYKINSEEDITYASKGEEFEFPADIPPVRYIRFKILSTHDGAGLVVMQQLWFYGTPIQ